MWQIPRDLTMVEKKSKKRKGDKDKAPEDGDQACGKPYQLLRECVGSLQIRRRNTILSIQYIDL